jgi:hypothetical protein
MTRKPLQSMPAQPQTTAMSPASSWAWESQVASSGKCFLPILCWPKVLGSPLTSLDPGPLLLTYDLLACCAASRWCILVGWQQHAGTQERSQMHSLQMTGLLPILSAGTWFVWGNNKYTLYPTPVTFGYAATVCSQAGGSLASFSSFFEYNVSLGRTLSILHHRDMNSVARACPCSCFTPAGCGIRPPC